MSATFLGADKGVLSRDFLMLRDLDFLLIND
jgi:hypothetical protein